MAGPTDPASIASLVNDLSRIQTYAEELQRVVRTADAAAPTGAAGSDSSGVAQAEVDQTGMPTSLRVSDRWEQTLTAAELGPALVEAYQTAVQSHLEAWGDDLERQGWRFDARELEERVAASPAGSPFEKFQPPPTVAAPRYVTSLLDDVMRELDESHELATAPPPPPPPPATTPGGRVAMRVSAGSLTSVAVDPDWAEGQSAGAVNAELAQALQSARLGADHTPGRDPRSDRLDGLFGEVMGFLQQHRAER